MTRAAEPWSGGTRSTDNSILPFAASILVATQVVEKIMQSSNLQVRGLIGLVVVAVALGWLTLLDADAEYSTGMFAQLMVKGLGVGTALVPFSVVIVSSTALQGTGITAGILQTTLTIGSSLGVNAATDCVRQS
ncbi:hypothetical protein [Rhodococcus sp. 27YEA15]|uniref:hypothetical protein n=1 Tax=Rhodococcus sp. 27YEA15 TaxID=3156259 RepID=UPI003C7CE601